MIDPQGGADLRMALVVRARRFLSCSYARECGAQLAACPDALRVARGHRRKRSNGRLQLDDVSLDVGDVAPRNLVSGANSGGDDLANC